MSNITISMDNAPLPIQAHFLILHLTESNPDLNTEGVLRLIVTTIDRTPFTHQSFSLLKTARRLLEQGIYEVTPKAVTPLPLPNICQN